MREIASTKKGKYSKGYAFIPGWLLFDDRVSADAKLTWIVIYKLIRKKRGEYLKIIKSYEALADLRGLSKRAIQRHMAELKKYEYASTWQRYNKSNVIILHMKKDE